MIELRGPSVVLVTSYLAFCQDSRFKIQDLAIADSRAVNQSLANSQY